MQFIKRIIQYIIIPLTILVSVVILGLYLATIPQYSGKIIHNREDIGNIEIQREKPYGIPHIKAKSMKDAFYGLGYVHSQDRLFSMHIKRRLSQGRLSEFAGEDTLQTDIFFRTVGIADTIKKVTTNIEPETREIMQAYINGINDQVHSMITLPIEFHILGENFEDWTLEDCVSIELMLNIFLSLDFYFEPLKDLVREKYGNDLAEEIFAAKDEYLFDKTYTLNDDDLKQSNIYQEFTDENLQIHIKTLKEKHHVEKTHLLENFIKLTQIELLENGFSQMKGSNAWVVDGTLTKTGKPILANDPHLDIIIPTIWYQTELLFEHEGQKKYVIGSTVAGMPAIVIGKSDYVTWGITNNMADSNDLYIEKLQKNKYFFDGEWIEMNQRVETIKIGKYGKHKNITVSETHHGPILPSMLDLVNLDKPFEKIEEYSFSWPGHQIKNNFVQCNLNMLVADSVEKIQKALRLMSDPVVNVIYATVDNDIGHISVGRVPVRNDPLNCYPLDGTKRENDWIRFYTGEEQPQVVNPKKHYIVNANNKVASDNLIHHITATSTTMSRSYRITKLIEEFIDNKQKIISEDFMKMQQDRVDQYCLETKPDFLKIVELYQKEFFTEESNQQKIDQIVKLLKDWPCDMASKGPNSVGAAIYGVWEQKLLSKYLNFLTDNVKINNRAALNLMFDHIFFFNLKKWAKGDRHYHEICITNNNKNSSKPCLYNFFESLIETFDFMKKKFPNSKSHESWSWGSINIHEFKHSPFSATPLKPFFGRNRPGGGNRRSINVGGINLMLDKWNSVYSANFRMVVDMSEGGKSYYVVDTGVSESVFSPHYTDQLDIFQDGKYIEMKFGYENFGNYSEPLFLLNKDSVLKQKTDEL